MPESLHHVEGVVVKIGTVLAEELYSSFDSVLVHKSRMFSILLRTYCYSRMLRIESFSSNVFWLKNTKLQTYVINKITLHAPSDLTATGLLFDSDNCNYCWMSCKDQEKFSKAVNCVWRMNHLFCQSHFATISSIFWIPASLCFITSTPAEADDKSPSFSGAVMSVAHISKATLSPLVCCHLQNHNCVNNRLTDCCFHLYRNIQKHAGIDIFFSKCLSRAKHVISRAGPLGRGRDQGESGRSELTALMTWLSFFSASVSLRWTTVKLSWKPQ